MIDFAGPLYVRDTDRGGITRHLSEKQARSSGKLKKKPTKKCQKQAETLLDLKFSFNRTKGKVKSLSNFKLDLLSKVHQ